MPHIDLLDLAPFADIPMGDVVSLIDAMAPRQWQPGEPLIRAGDVPDGLLVVTAGSVIATPPLGTKSVLKAPLVLPVAAFFARGQASAGVEADSLVSAFTLTHKTFEQLLVQGHPALARFLTNLLSLGEGLHGCKGLG